MPRYIPNSSKLKGMFLALIKSKIIIVVWIVVSTAQTPTNITSDGTLGTTVTPDGTIYEVTDGTRAGSNLFHSFERFDVGTGDTAHFIGQMGVNNIIGRVTGGAGSMIDGRLQSDATLFLLNPSGIMFGSSATLDINGSFHASTAEVMRFADGQDFIVRVSPEASLSVSSPSAFGFMNAHEPIRIQGSTLEVAEGETLSIVGGDIDIAGGTLEAPSGRINLASVASAGDVAFAGGDLNTDSLSALGSITMTEESQLDASGALGRVGGQIVIRGGQLTMTNSDILVTNRSDQTGGGVDVVVDGAITLVDTAILSDTFATGQGGHIVLQADTVTIEGERIRTNTTGGGQGGDIRVEAATVLLTGGAQLRSDSRGNGGAAGDIIIHGRDELAAQSITLLDSLLSTEVLDQGEAGGDIFVTAEAVVLDNARLVATTMNAGDAGSITLSIGDLTAAENTIITSSSTGGATGDAGDITIQGLTATDAAATVSLIDSALLTSTTGSGTGGAITVTAERVDLDNANLNAATTGSGDTRNITLNVVHLSTARGTDITTNSTAQGTAGDITIQGLPGTSAAALVALDDSELLTSTAGTEDGGTIIVTAERLELDEARLTATTEGIGQAGDITLNVNHLSAMPQTLITTNSMEGTGPSGNVTIRGLQGAGSMAQDVIFDRARINSDTRSSEHSGAILIQAETLRLINGTQLRSRTIGEGSGGRIALQAGALTIETSSIESTTFGAGRGGAIDIAVDTLTLADDTLLSSESRFPGTGDAGAITIQGRGGDGAAATLVTLRDSTLQTNTASREGIGGTGAITITAEAVVLDQVTLNAATTGAHHAGDITLHVGSLTAMGTTITTGSTEGATGDAGDIAIQGLTATGAATTVTLTDSALLTSTTGSGTGGAITVTAETVNLNNANLNAATTGSGDARNITLNVGRLETMRGTEITSSSTGGTTDDGDAGDINIRGLTATDAATTVMLTASELRTSTTGSGAGGTITVTSDLVRMDTSTLAATTGGTGRAGDISLNVNRLDATSRRTIINTNSTGTGPSGNVTIRGLQQGSAAQEVTLDSARISNETSSPKQSGEILVQAEMLTLSNGAQLRSTTLGEGTGGRIALHVGTLTIDGSSIQSDTFGTGRGGAIDFAVDTLTLSGGAVLSSDSRRTNAGDAGAITIQGRGGNGTAAHLVTLRDESTLQTNTVSRGDGGTITLTADTVMLDTANLSAITEGSGDAGNITLKVRRLHATQETLITNSSTEEATGDAGRITIQGLAETEAAEAVTLIDSSLLTQTTTGIGGQITIAAGAVELVGANLTATTTGTGDAGAIILNVGRLNATEQTHITSSSTEETTDAGDAGRITIQGLTETEAAEMVMLTDSRLGTQTSAGAGGTITVTSEAIDLQNANLTAATTGAGHAGAITLNVDRLNATDQTLMTSSSTADATGNAGRVSIQGIGGTGTAADMVTLNNSEVQTQAASEAANGGAIRVQAQLIRLRDESAIRSDTERGQRGGNIDLDAAFVILENSDVIANSEDAPVKADINIAGALIADARSVVQASGGVSVFGSVFDLSSAVQPPLAFLQQAALSTQRCARRLRSGQISSFAVVGRDGLPLQPGRMLLSDLTIEEEATPQEGQRPQSGIKDMQHLLSVAWHFDCDQ